MAPSAHRRARSSPAQPVPPGKGRGARDPESHLARREACVGALQSEVADRALQAYNEHTHKAIACSDAVWKTHRDKPRELRSALPCPSSVSQPTWRAGRPTEAPSPSARPKRESGCSPRFTPRALPRLVVLGPKNNRNLGAAMAIPILQRGPRATNATPPATSTALSTSSHGRKSCAARAPCMSPSTWPNACPGFARPSARPRPSRRRCHSKTFIDQLAAGALVRGKRL